MKPKSIKIKNKRKIQRYVDFTVYLPYFDYLYFKPWII